MLLKLLSSNPGQVSLEFVILWVGHWKREWSRRFVISWWELLRPHRHFKKISGFVTMMFFYPIMHLHLIFHSIVGLYFFRLFDIALAFQLRRSKRFRLVNIPHLVVPSSWVRTGLPPSTNDFIITGILKRIMRPNEIAQMRK